MINYDRRFIENKLKLKQKFEIKEKPKRGYIIIGVIALIILFLI